MYLFGFRNYILGKPAGWLATLLQKTRAELLQTRDAREITTVETSSLIQHPQIPSISYNSPQNNHCAWIRLKFQLLLLKNKRADTEGGKRRWAGKGLARASVLHFKQTRVNKKGKDKEQHNCVAGHASPSWLPWRQTSDWLSQPQPTD